MTAADRANVIVFTHSEKRIYLREYIEAFVVIAGFFVVPIFIWDIRHLNNPLDNLGGAWVQVAYLIAYLASYAILRFIIVRVIRRFKADPVNNGVRGKYLDSAMIDRDEMSVLSADSTVHAKGRIGQEIVVAGNGGVGVPCQLDNFRQ